MLEDLRRERVFLFRDVTGFFEEGQIDVGLDIALRARITIPVPGAAEIAAFFDDSDALDAGLAQTRAREQAAETAADDHYLDLVVQRSAGEAGIDIGIVDVAAEVTLHFDVLLI